MITKLYYNPINRSYRVGVKLTPQEQNEIARKNIQMIEEYKLGKQVGEKVCQSLKS